MSSMNHDIRRSDKRIVYYANGQTVAESLPTYFLDGECEKILSHALGFMPECHSASKETAKLILTTELSLAKEYTEIDEDAFPKILERNGLRKIRFHDLRHTCASLMHKMGLSPKEVQDYLGHSTVSVTVNVRNPHTNKM